MNLPSRFTSHEPDQRERLILERISDAFVALDNNARCTYANEHAGRFLKRRPEDLIGKHIWTEFPESVGRPFQHRCEEAMASQQSVSFEDYFAPWDRWFESRLYPSPNGVSIFFHEITERKRAEAVLRDSQAHLLLAVESSNTGLWDWNLATNEVYYSAIWKRQIGYQDHEIQNRFDEWQSRVHPDDLQHALKVVNDFLASPWPNYENEFRFRHKDGSYRWILTKAALLRDEHGNPARMLGSHLDITERKRVEEMLRASEAKLREQLREIEQIYAYSPIGLFIFDREYRFLRINERMAQINGFSIAHHIGKTLDEIAPDLATFLKEAYRPIFERGEPVLNVEIHGKTPKDPEHERDWIGNYFPLMSETGEVIGLIGAVLEITERKQAEELQQKLEEQLRQSQKMEAVGTLAGGIAHDFNNLLSAILGNAELAHQDIDSAHPVQVSIEEIRRAGQRAKQLVQRLLAFGRPQESERKPVQLAPIVEEAIRLLRSTLPAGVELNFNATATAAVRADASQVHQVVLNLATNAWHALSNHAGHIDIRLAACRVDSSLRRLHPELQVGPHVQLTVSDSGSGIDAAILNRIFEPFFTTKPAGQGSGLGLSVVHGIVRSHGGAIGVESQPGHGTTFNIYFPACDDSAVSTAGTTAISVRGSGERILFIDDEEPLVYLTVRFLERLGYRVDGYTQATEALASFAADPDGYDLAITDYNMPGMTGLEVAQRLLQIRPNATVVLASGYVRPQEIEQARALGIREIILKPNTVEELAPVVQRLLAERGQVPDAIAAPT